MQCCDFVHDSIEIYFYLTYHTRQESQNIWIKHIKPISPFSFAFPSEFVSTSFHVVYICERSMSNERPCARLHQPLPPNSISIMLWFVELVLFLFSSGTNLIKSIFPQHCANPATIDQKARFYIETTAGSRMHQSACGRESVIHVQTFHNWSHYVLYKMTSRARGCFTSFPSHAGRISEDWFDFPLQKLELQMPEVTSGMRRYLMSSSCACSFDLIALTVNCALWNPAVFWYIEIRLLSAI